VIYSRRELTESQKVKQNSSACGLGKACTVSGSDGSKGVVKPHLFQAAGLDAVPVRPQTSTAVRCLKKATDSTTIDAGRLMPHKNDTALEQHLERAAAKAPLNRISTFLLFATVAAAPLPFGSTTPPAIAFWCIVLGIAAITASPRGLRGGQFALLGLAAIVIAAYGLVLNEQLATHPWFAGRKL
jgi:hypothetical protein